MKKILFLLMFVIVMTLTACGRESTTYDESNGENSKNEVSATPTHTSVHSGTRTDPYEFGDDIVICSKAVSGEYAIEYTLQFDEIWGSNKVKEEYINYSIHDRILVRGTIEVRCDTTDDEIDFNLNPVFVTDTLNEEGADIQTFKSGELNNQLQTVYSGGTYNIIVLGSNDGIAAMSVQYLKISYTNADSEDAGVWIVLPEITDNKLEETNNDSDNSDKTTETDNSSSVSPTPIPKMTRKKLETALLKEPMYVESTKYVVQSEEYKLVYPDMLQAIIKNNSGTDIKNAVLAFVAWDANGFPVKIDTESYGDPSYVQKAKCSDVNLIDGDTYGEGKGLALDSRTENIKTFKAIVVSYDDFDGNTWENPYYDTWVEMYADKKLK